jgi:hypothetical protein
VTRPGDRKGRRWAVVAAVAAVFGVLWQLLRLPTVPAGPSQTLIALEALLCAGLIPALIVHLLRSAPGFLGALRRRPIPAVPILCIAGAAFALRALLPPIFLHVEFVGLKYWSMALDPRLLYEQDPSFGRGGLMTQGILASVLGGSVRAFFAGNAFLSAATVALGGFLVARWSPERRLAPVAAAALLALHPLLVRVGASEDVHVVAGFWAFLSIALLERHRDDGRDADLLAAIAAAVLATCSRQFLLPMPLLFGLLWFERGPRPRRLGRPAAIAGVALLVGTALLKAAFLLPGVIGAGSGIQHGAGAALSSIIRMALFLSKSSITEPHPLIDQWMTTAPVLALTLWGLLQSRRGGFPRSLVLGWLWLLVLSLPVGYWGISVRYLFRSLLVLLSLVAAGTGLGDLLVRLRARGPWLPAAAVSGLLLVAGALAIPRIVAEAPMDPFTRQVFWLEATVPGLPRDSILFTPSEDELGTPNLYLKIPELLLNPEGNELRRQRPMAALSDFDDVPDPPPMFLFHGVVCHGVSVFELDSAWQAPDRLVSGEDAAGLGKIIHAPHPGDSWIRSRRGPCEIPGLPVPGPGDPGLDIPPVGLDNGNMFYEGRPFRIGLHRLP